jgi:hypothetical protein
MVEERISKMIARNGEISDLPMLDPGEFGYAKDERRLFIGNDVVDVGTGNGIDTEFYVDIDLNNPYVIAAFVGGTQVSAVDFSLVGTTLTFNTAPGLGEAIQVAFNSEINILKDVSRTLVTSLPANGSSSETGFAVQTAAINAGVLDYTLVNTNGTRIGQLRFAYDATHNSYAIDDNFTETGTVDIVFDMDISTTGVAKLVYTDADNSIATFKFVYQLWNS